MNSSADGSTGNSGTGVPPVWRLLLQRLAIMLPTLVGVTVLLCAIAHFTPGRPSSVGPDASLSSGQTAALGAWQTKRFGLDEPFHVRYGMWMKRIVAGQDMVMPLGESAMTGRSVREELGPRLLVTLALSSLALALALLVALPAGVVMALRAGGTLDRAIFAVLLTLWSVPLVVMATLLLAFLTKGGDGLAIFPSAGGTGFAHLVLPAVCMAIVTCAPLARQVRAAILEQLGKDYVQTALAKGLSRGAVLRRHVFRPALGPIVHVLALLVPKLIAGSVLVETVFNVDGMGRLAWRSAVNRDLDVVLMIALLTAIAHMVSLLLADVVAMLLDPRVRLDGRRT